MHRTEGGLRLQLGVHRWGGKWSESGCSCNESGPDCRWVRKKAVKGAPDLRPEVEMEVEGRQEKCAGQWVKMPVTPPGEMAGGRRDRRIESSGQRQDLGRVRLGGTGSHEDR